MGRKRCAGCGRFFSPRANIPRQEYCSTPGCQRVRKREWQAEKLKADQDYRENQCRAYCRWREEHPDYWREYRQAHPEYILNNRKRQRIRDRKRRQGVIFSPVSCTDLLAKMDE